MLIHPAPERPVSKRLSPEVEVTAQDDNQHKDGGGHFQLTPTLGALGAVFVRDRAEREVLDLIVVGGRRHITHHDHDHRGDDGDENAEVLEVDVINDPEERAMGIALGDGLRGVLVAKRPQRDRCVHQHTEQANDKADNHGPQAALGIEAFPEYAKEEDHKNRRGQVALDGLQITVEALGRSFW